MTITSSDVAYLMITALLAYSMSLSLRVGLFSIAPAGFAGLGGYIFGLLTVNEHWQILLATVAAIAGCLAAGAALALPLGRIRGVYTSIATLAFVVVMTDLENSLSITGGTLGLVRIPYGDMRLPGAVGVLLAALLFYYLDHSFAGRRLDIIRHDPVRAQTLGSNVALARFWTLAVSAGIAGYAGALYAREYNYISPSDFAFTFAIAIAASAVFGGYVHWLGPLIGSLLLGLLGIYLTSYVGWSDVISGLVLAWVMVWQPLGLGGVLRHVLRYRWQARRITAVGWLTRSR
jgi:branched-chain amino acid transport system permease protein